MRVRSLQNSLHRSTDKTEREARKAEVRRAEEEMQANSRAAEFAKKYAEKGEKVQLEEGGKKSVVS